MTVIAWDGRELAADKQAENGSTKMTVTKIVRAGRLLAGYAGESAVGAEMLRWVQYGRRLEDFPAIQREENCYGSLVVIDDGRILVYQRTPDPIVVEDPVYACGSGRDFAIAAMYCGRSARDAVMVACMFDAGCGMGVDTLEAGAASAAE